jgi:16S rRNA (guanine(966)-N(2))-methyltransferase RsmD
LGDRVVDAVALDLYAGTGAMGLESLSRGSRAAVFVDAGSEAVRLIKRNLDLCGFSGSAKVIRRDLLKSPSFLLKIMPQTGFDLIFVDPPYRREISVKTLKYLGRLNLLSKDGLLVTEEASDVEVPEEIGGLKQIDRRVYGDTAVCFYRNNIDEKQHE